MRKLLIVDDERNIRLGLKAMLERQFPDRFELLFATDGTEALEAIEAAVIDIMITDIRMPGIDGLELIRRADKLDSKPETIILSGFDDFHYAKEAIRYGVNEYLLKPIVRDELFQAVERAEQGRMRKEQIDGQLHAVERLSAELRSAQLGYLLMSGDLEEEEIDRRCRENGLAVFENGFTVAVFRVADDGFTWNGLEQALSEHVHEGGACGVVDKDGHFALLLKQEEQISRIMQEWSGKPGGKALSVGISAQATRLGQLPSAYAEAKHALKHRLLQAQPGVIKYEEAKRLEHTFEAPTETVRKLANMLGTGREAEMKQLLEELFDRKRVSRFDIGYIENVSRLLNERVFDEAFRQYGEESVEIIRMYRRAGDPFRFETVADYARAVDAFVFKLDDYIRNVKSAHLAHKEMRKAVEYMDANYAADLNMAMVSNYVSLNYSYFSETFKAYTGESFVVYLKKLRIAKAKELLQATGAKVYEIGEQVGFENVKQFNRVFRELEGISATEYRRKFGLED
ncbi:two component transcriptional regulator, AraC family [Paenibacillus curdlanolyticus YK9]|uniref:Two component transcriptional regulator, AraC family n=1 Tax=Paenibacillus curdlanolyticus YK9 TaxID=717606 RepID=E0IAH8_9BACL|nr:response regulator [Paenibacillus curdlanolyticus]EFM10755.1 two component transcriptional regulator, AraC family [Paenibacillus curdlanolyticus YK9]